MKEILTNLTNLERATASEKGPYDLFAIFLREDSFDKWDLLVSASWIEDRYNEALGYLTRKLNSTLPTEQLLTISKVVPLDEFDERVSKVLKAIQVEHRPTEIHASNFFGINVELAWIITSKQQVDKELLPVVWETLAEVWKSGERAVYSGDVLQALKKKGAKPQPGALRRVFDFLLDFKCIRAAKFIDSDGIREHGAMTITSVIPHCSKLESYFNKQEKINLLGLDGRIFDLGYEKWLLQVDDVFEHQGPVLTYYLYFVNLNDSTQGRKLNLTISYQYLIPENRDRYNAPPGVWQWMYGWLFDKRPVETVMYDQEIALQHT